jgi:GNAT superfamily N-acetyltransferase
VGERSVTGYRIGVEESPPQEDVQAIVHNLVRFNDAQVGPERWRQLAAFIRDAEGAVLGGLDGYTHWDWLFISHLWVVEALRGRGFGTALVRAAEQEALSRGCRNAHVDTYDFQARVFYERLGYEVFGVLDDYPAGHTRYFLHRRALDHD